MILGHDQSSTLLYGHERLPAISLTLAFPDGRSVELGQAPVIDQQGIAGLTGRVDNHWWRLFGAVFIGIGGALRGGQQALQIGLAQAGGAGRRRQWDWRLRQSSRATTGWARTRYQADDRGRERAAL